MLLRGHFLFAMRNNLIEVLFVIERIGNRTIHFTEPPKILGCASVVGKKEGDGPLGGLFDKIIYDSYDGLDTYEDAESRLQTEAASIALGKCGLRTADIDVAFAGDLLNQCVGSTFGLKDYNIPYLGQYGACSTMAQNLIAASVFIASGAAKRALCSTSSHFCSAERQYRYPLEYGAVRTPTAQWTVTGAGCCVLGSTGESAIAKITRATVGKILDLGVKDPNNMGAAMAPAASETLAAFFKDTGSKPADFDCIFTGDLGEVGSKSLYDLLGGEGYDIRDNHFDCGLLIYDRRLQDVHSGGSGCGCCASVLCSKILRELENKQLKNVLFIATGALLSSTTAAQSKTIPSIAHLVDIQCI